MIRFEPDTWSDALLRFFAMAAPDSNVYVEIAAPDLRFAAMVLIGAGVALSWRRLAGNPRPAGALLAFLLLTAASWIATSGNGRYFMPMLLCIGPLVAGLVYLLPLSRFLRLCMAGGLLAAQAYAVFLSSPWDAWSWVAWDDAPYFQIEAPAKSAGPATTYVTISSISYSLIAPQFPADSRWINITTAGGLARDRDWAQDFLRAAKGPIDVLVPTIPGLSTADGKPQPEVRTALDALLAPQKLGLDPGQPCRVLHSRGMAAIQGRHYEGGAKAEHIGFWSCPLRYPVATPPAQMHDIPAKTEAAFARIETDCPRFFQPGSAKTQRINGGAMRHYAGADIKLYVLEDGTVWYKFWRALNPVVIGTVDGVVRGADKVKCDQIRGRAGLPWDREI